MGYPDCCKSVALCALIGSLGQLNAADGPEWKAKLSRHELKFSDERVLRYRLFDPRSTIRSSDIKSFPLVIFLHGAGERGDDNDRQLVHGVQDLTSERVQLKNPCFVVAPQCPVGQQWVDTPWTALSHRMKQRPSQSLTLVIELINRLERELPIDRHRIYVTGLSMGGFGVWDLIQRFPHRFAAAVPICGGGDVEQAGNLAILPLWVFHGDNDTVVKPSRSRDMIKAVRSAGGRPRYTEYAGVGHNAWTVTYRNAELYDWLFSQVKRGKQ